MIVFTQTDKSSYLVGGGCLKKNLSIIIRCLIGLIFVAVLFFRLWDRGAFIFDRTADVDLQHVTWNGKHYSPITGEYSEGRTIARGKEADWVINSVKEDPSHTFIVARSFLDQELMVLDDYTVPTSGELTTVCWHWNYISDPLFLDAMQKIEAEKTTSFTYQTENIVYLTENQHMRSLYFAYEHCPVTTNYKGYMGKVNGEWVITTYISQDQTTENGTPKLFSVGCYTIPNQYWDILSKYF